MSNAAYTTQWFAVRAEAAGGGLVQNGWCVMDGCGFGNIVATVHDHGAPWTSTEGQKQSKARATLLAAAPKLLEACGAALWAMTCAPADDVEGGICEANQSSRAIDLLRAAIAKAEATGDGAEATEPTQAAAGNPSTDDLLNALRECVTEPGARCMVDESRHAASICRKRLDYITMVARDAIERAERRKAAEPDLLTALEGLLAQVTGPAAVYGDGRGNDGKKTGLSHWEFNELRDRRIADARAAIAKATGN